MLLQYLKMLLNATYDVTVTIFIFRSASGDS